jgi:hypothetical protein
MSKIIELNKKHAELINRAYFLDENDEDYKLELDKINRDLANIAEEADNVTDWLAQQIHDAQWAKNQADALAKMFERKKKVASDRLDFFKRLALDFMKTHDIKQSRGELFGLSYSLTPGSINFNHDFDPNLLPDEFTVTIPAVPEHKEASVAALSKCLRSCIFDEEAGKLDQETKIVQIPELPGVVLIRADSLKVK